MQFLKPRVPACLPTLAMMVSMRAAAQDTTRVAKPPAQRIGRVVGVFDAESSEPLEGADVIDRIGGMTLRTLGSGLVGLAAFVSQHDSAVVTIRKIGYADTTLLVMVGARDTVPMAIFLRHVASLDSMVVTAHEVEHLSGNLRDFQERLTDAKASGAKTFTPQEMRKNDGRRLFDLLTSKGIGKSTPRCSRLGVYLDGVPYTPTSVVPGSAGVPDEDVDNYDAVVFYTGAQMPAEFRRTGGGCAVLLLYSRGKA